MKTLDNIMSEAKNILLTKSRVQAFKFLKEELGMDLVDCTNICDNWAKQNAPLPTMQWISVDKLNLLPKECDIPPISIDVLVLIAPNEWYEGYYNFDKNEWRIEQIGYEAQPTHFMIIDGNPK